MNPFLTLGIFLVSAAGIGWSVKTARQVEREKADLVERIERLEMRTAPSPESDRRESAQEKMGEDIENLLLRVQLLEDRRR